MNPIDEEKIKDDPNKEIVNPFKGYLANLQKHKQAVNPVHEIVNCYYKMNGWQKMPKTFYTGRYAYNKLAKEAKMLLTACNGVLDDAIWALDKMKYLANKGGFDWSIATCLKHKLS